MRFVRREAADRVAMVAMDRPEVLNALNSRMLSELHACFSGREQSEAMHAFATRRAAAVELERSDG